MRHAGPARRELGVPTVFNILGPMANPAQVRRLVVGLADASLAERMLGVMRQRGAQRVLIVHGDDGLDELTTTTRSTVWELDGGEIRTWTVDPAEFGLAPARAAGGRGCGDHRRWRRRARRRAARSRRGRPQRGGGVAGGAVCWAGGSAVGAALDDGRATPSSTAWSRRRSASSLA
jgi:anthranilate phosphoribosyltransferase